MGLTATAALHQLGSFAHQLAGVLAFGHEVVAQRDSERRLAVGGAADGHEQGFGELRAQLEHEVLHELCIQRQHARDDLHTVLFLCVLNELLLQTLLSFEDRATKKNLDVDPQLPENSVLVVADKDAITRVIYNLLDNAVKFANPGSCLTLRLYKDGEKAYVSVKDIGETIPPDDLPFIFDRFHKSDRSRSLDKDGVGLGLYLVKAIINAHDEDIAVRSEDGMTEFVFTLPLAEPGR